VGKWMLGIALAAFTALPGSAQTTLKATVAGSRPVRAGVATEGKLSFDGRANVGKFTGTTTTIRGELSGGDDLTMARGWVEAPVGTLATGNDKRDRDLNRSMESDKYPTIRFELTGVVLKGESNDSAQVDLQGTFQIHGVRRDATIPATVVFAGDAIRVRGDTPLSLKDYRIGGLSKALGMLRMYQDIVVHIDVAFGPAAGGPTARIEY